TGSGATHGKVDPIISTLVSFFDDNDLVQELRRCKHKNSTESEGWSGPELALVVNVVREMRRTPHPYGNRKTITKTKIG
ncbi:hypothetical protein K439DRAFT_1643199, partial [Ramaria rubella]